MVKVHTRKKTSRIRGARTCGWGFRQKHKGHGNRGGVGMAGSGKRADHKNQKAKSMDTKTNMYFGKQGLTSRGTRRVKENKINLDDIKANLFKKDGDKIDLSKHVILGTGDGFKAEITAKKASKGAIEKMEKAGGSIIIKETRKKEKPAKKEVKDAKPTKKVKKGPKKEVTLKMKQAAKKEAKKEAKK
jgi:large subunit ribosomal protein L15